MLSLSSRSVGRVARPARLVSRNRRARIGTSVPQRGFRRGIVRAAAADDDEDADADDDDETHREYDETYDGTHLEDASTHTEDDDADVAAFKAFSADLDARYGLRSQPPPRAAYVSTPAGPSSSLTPPAARHAHVRYPEQHLQRRPALHGGAGDMGREEGDGRVQLDTQPRRGRSLTANVGFCRRRDGTRRRKCPTAKRKTRN